MTASPELAADVALFLLETTIQSLLFCLVVLVAIRALGIQHPGVRAGLWLMVLVCPLAVPLVFHVILPRAGTRPEPKILETFLAAPLAWLNSHQLLVALAVALVLAILFSLDVLRWLLCGLRAGSHRQATLAAREQNARCAALLSGVSDRLGSRTLPALRVSQGQRDGVYVLRWPRPTICLSWQLANHLVTEELQALLAHEMAHLQRRDWLQLLVAQLCRDLAFFNPVAHLAYARFLQATEEAADDAAAISNRDRLALASCLVKVQRFLQSTGTVQPGPGLVHRPTDTSRRAARLLQGEAVQPCPALHRRIGWIMMVLALLLGGVI